jgi:tetraacyldisaccharide 4'-kinase
VKILKIIVFPFSLIYGSVTAIRNLLYNLSVLRSNSFNLPVISVGNLSLGGTGKTPHVEYLVRLLIPVMKTATLSRGYKRKTKGFIEAKNNSSISEIGDEPKQYKAKFPELMVTVCEDRSHGISEILKIYKTIRCILLDDAFQHRSVKAGMNILLTDFSKLYANDCIFPSGTLREFRCGSKRADIIVVTKCPEHISEEERNLIIRKIDPKAYQHVFFSFIKYEPFKAFDDSCSKSSSDKTSSVLLFSGIANIKPLEKYLAEKKYSLQSLQFGDHHEYSIGDLVKIKETFNNIADENKIILTTEKDVMRIETEEQKGIFKGLPVYYVPIAVDFSEKDKKMFNEIILDYVTHAGKN